jgi:hypothetical protein
MLRATIVGITAGVLLASLPGCGKETGKFECCLNGAYFSCANQAQFDTCHITSPDNQCTRDPSKDPTCG